jgi:aspartyl-tRNA(Asn)/glutamyl-tRNA(Gln) amidotransferase subunit A
VDDRINPTQQISRNMKGPTMTDSLWRQSATTLGTLFAAGQVTPVDALDAVVARLHAVNPRLNAVIASDDAGAREAAVASARRWARHAPLSPIDGVPFTVKDNIAVAGMPVTWGNAAYRAIAPTGDELPVARLRSAGAVLIGKTNVPEFTSQGYTSNAVFGPTRNPWNTDLTPGGSSGGAVASVAAGIGPFALGTDGGGSIRRPASHTGLFGLKPSLGRVARCDGLPAILLDFEVIGPIARCVADLVAVMSVIVHSDPRDPTSLDMGPFSLPEPGRRRIRYVTRFGGHPVDPEIVASTDAVARALGEAGHIIEPGEAPFDTDAAARIQSTIGQAGLAWLGDAYGIAPVAEGLAETAAVGARMPASALFAALDATSALRRAMSVFFTQCDLILTPAAAALPWSATEVYPPSIAGLPVGPRGHAVYTAFANIAGLPGVTIPGPHSAGGLPIGAQLIGPRGGDGLLLAVAGQVEARHPDWIGWPALD